MATTQRVFICRGKDCRKRNKQRRALCDALEGRAQLCNVDCQRICKGPVIGMEINGRVEWFAQIASEKVRRSAVEFLESGELTKPLKRRRIRKRRGMLRGESQRTA